jgi:hypothetical protein
MSATARYDELLNEALQPLHKGLQMNKRLDQQKPFRTALVVGKGITAERVTNYLPSNYTVVDADVTGADGDSVIIGGHDVAGWTIEAYIAPRLGTGGMYVVEADDDDHGDQFVDEADFRDSEASDR